MTSATGSVRRGFTLTELMIVISIMMLLMGFVVAAAVKYKKVAYQKSAEGMIQELQIAIDEFKNINGAYPSDGMDSPFETEDTATELQSGAALTYQLSRPVKRPIQQPGGRMHWVVSDPVTQFKREDLMQPDADIDDVYILIDPWGAPIHYDCLARGTRDYSLHESEDCHACELIHGEIDGADPREEEGVAVETAGPQNPGRYDLWMHGPGGHTADQLAAGVVCNWVKPVEP